MYKNIKSFEITESSITFETVAGLYGRFTTQIPFSFTRQDQDIQKQYICDDGHAMVIYKSNLTIYSPNRQMLIKFYIPTLVRHYIEKDIQSKGIFTLEYRKHLRSEYDNTKHVFIKMNYIDDDEPAVSVIRRKAIKYSKGIHNQPIVICYYDANLDQIYYAIVKDNIVVESGYENSGATDNIELPDIFTSEE